MMYKTHIVFALFFYLILCLIFNFPKNFYILLIIAFSSLIPDIDSTSSFINKKIKFGKIIAITSKHRGFWHSIFGLLIFFIISLILSKIIIIMHFPLYVSIGYITHLIADSLTINGIKPLWKFSNFHIKGKIKTASLFEYILFIFLLILTIFIYSPKQFINFTAYLIKNLKNKI
ncbi:MAG: metal-dependent hydrolase [Candidatus Pacearchaeota archaeon]